jgi:probable HAF family extracellular repeat protein
MDHVDSCCSKNSKGELTMGKRKNKCGLFVAGTLASLILALQPVLVLGNTLATQASSYIFITVDIPTSSGQFGFTSLDDINDQGEIVGNFVAGPVGFLLDAKSRFTDIECPGAIDSTAAKSINKRGEISGFCFAGGRVHGFFRDKKGQYTLLDFPGATLAEAIGINDDGQVVGDYRDSDGRFHGFFWDAGLFLTFDVPFPEATSTAPNAINNVGQIVGFYFDNNVTEMFPNGHAHGFLYHNGTFSSFDVPGASETLPLDINDHGQIVGVYANSDMVAHSFLLEDGRLSTFEIPFPGVVFTDVSGINNRGQIVGRYLENNPDDIFNPFFNHGFIATPKSEPKGKSQLFVSKSNHSPSAQGGVTIALALGGCPGSVPQPGYVTPAKLLGRWIFCSQGMVPR